VNAVQCFLPVITSGESYCYSVAHYLCSQADFPDILCNRDGVDICQIILSAE